MSTASTLQVRVVMPHHYLERTTGKGYGSTRKGERPARSLALGRTLSALIGLQRCERDLVLNIGEHCLEWTPPLLRGNALQAGIQLELQVFTHGGHTLVETLELFAGQLTLHEIELEDPRTLALVARDFLIQTERPADLNLYLEDDLVITDPLFLDKQLWFLHGCGHRCVLMPHRLESLPGRQGQRLLVDGPLREGLIQQFTQPQPGIGSGQFWNGEEVRFDRTANPHSGLFCLSREQVELLRETELPRDGFIGPLETAATLTVLRHFDVLKPALAHRHFLTVEHAHRSFAGLAAQWRRPPLEGATPG